MLVRMCLRNKIGRNGPNVEDGRTDGFFDTMFHHRFVDSEPVFQGPHGLGVKMFVNIRVENIAVAMSHVASKDV
jgi:hypothetical protein